MEKQANDHIERLFKKYLSGDAPPNYGLDAPGDDLLFNALDKIEGKKNRKPVFWLWLAIGLLGVFSIGTLVWTNVALQEVNTTLQDLQLQDQLNPVDAKQDLFKETLPSLLVPKEESTSKNTNKLFSTNKFSSTKIHQPAVSDQGNREVSPTISVETKEAVLTKEMEQLPPRIDAVRTLHSAPIYAQSQQTLGLPVVQPTVVIAEEVQAQNNIPKSIEIHGGPKWTSFGMKGRLDNGPTMRDYDQSQLGYEAGLSLVQPIKGKWYWRGQVAYSSFSNRSWYLDEAPFEQENLSVDANGDFWYRSAVEVNTPTGTTMQNQSISLRSSNIADQEVMDVKAKVKQHFDLLEGSARIGYQIFQKEKLSLGIELGPNLGFTTGYQEWAGLNFSKDDAQIMFIETNSDSKSQVNNWVFGASAQLQLNYQWSSRVYSGLRLGGYRSLSALNGQEGPIRTHLRSHQLSISTGISF